MRHTHLLIIEAFWNFSPLIVFLGVSLLFSLILALISTIEVFFRPYWGHVAK